MSRTYFSRGGSEPAEIRRLEVGMGDVQWFARVRTHSGSFVDYRSVPRAEVEAWLSALSPNLTAVWLPGPPPEGARWSPSRRRFVDRRAALEV